MFGILMPFVLLTMQRYNVFCYFAREKGNKM